MTNKLLKVTLPHPILISDCLYEPLDSLLNQCKSLVPFSAKSQSYT